MLVYVLPLTSSHPDEASFLGEISRKLAENGHAAVFGDNLGFGAVVGQVVSRCDAILDLEGQSFVSTPYLEGLPVYTWPDVPAEDPIERSCPEQTLAFRQVLTGLYRQHLKKCSDYSPANILVTGEMGVLVRVADKIMRLLSLAGFDVKVTAPADFATPKDANFESSEDSWRDLANYGVINLLLRQGKWGR